MGRWGQGHRMEASSDVRSGLAGRLGSVEDDAMEFNSRVATEADADRLRSVMDASISELQKGFFTNEQIQSSRVIMGIDQQLIADGTYCRAQRRRRRLWWVEPTSDAVRQ